MIDSNKWLISLLYFYNVKCSFPFNDHPLVTPDTEVYLGFVQTSKKEQFETIVTVDFYC